MLDGSTYPGCKMCHFNFWFSSSCISKRNRLYPGQVLPPTRWWIPLVVLHLYEGHVYAPATERKWKKKKRPLRLGFLSLGPLSYKRSPHNQVLINVANEVKTFLAPRWSILSPLKLRETFLGTMEQNLPHWYYDYCKYKKPFKTKLNLTLCCVSAG